METLKLKQVDNGWLLTCDIEDDDPYIIVKEGSKDFHGLIDHYIDTFYDEILGKIDPLDFREFEVKIELNLIK